MCALVTGVQTCALPISTASTPAASRSTTATAAPSRANRNAPARPMPDAAAVTMPILSSRRMCFLLLLGHGYARRVGRTKEEQGDARQLARARRHGVRVREAAGVGRARPGRDEPPAGLGGRGRDAGGQAGSEAWR